MSMNNSAQPNQIIDLTEETSVESEPAATNVDELIKLRRVNLKAIHMIKACYKKIQQQDKEIRKIKRDNAMDRIGCAQVSDKHEKYDEILKLKDQHIEDLENKVRDFQKHMENAQNINASGNRQQLLTRHLQGLTNFLGKLLSHKCVLGEDKKKLAKGLLAQCLALPVGLELDESTAIRDLTMNESMAFQHLTIDETMAIRDLTMDERVDMLEDLTNMLGHHLACDEPSRPSTSPCRRRLSLSADLADSECSSDSWSRLDRIGNEARAPRAKLSGSSSDDEHDVSDVRLSVYAANALIEPELNRERERRAASKNCARLNAEWSDLNAELENKAKEMDQLSAENLLLKADLESERLRVSEANKSIETLRATIANLEGRINEVGQVLGGGVRATKAAGAEEVLWVERRELKATEKRRARRHAAQAALERKLERKLDRERDRQAAALETNSGLEIEATRRTAEVAVLLEGPSEEDRPTSPDLGIDSDRLSSLEQNKVATLSPRNEKILNITYDVPCSKRTLH